MLARGSGSASPISRRWFSVYVFGHSLGFPPRSGRKDGSWPSFGVSWKRKGRAHWLVIVP